MNRYLEHLQAAVARLRLYTVFAPNARSVGRVFVLFLAAFSTACSAQSFAAEEWNDFLAALKARGYDDVALVYLKQLQASDSAPPELNAELDYKIGAAAFDAWVAAPASTRASLAAEARAAFEKYLADAPKGENVYEANIGMTRLIVDEADRAYVAATRKGVSEDAKNAKLMEARNAYSEAKPYLTAATKVAQERAKSLQNAEGARVEKVQEAQAAYLDALVRMATLQAQTARTFAPSSDDYKTGLETARDQFEKISATYGQYAGAFKARFLQAEACRDLGDAEQAVSLLEELAVLPWEDRFVSLKTRALALYADIADEMKDPAVDMNLVVKYNNWKSEKLSEEYYASAEGLRLQLLAGAATIRLEKTRRTDFNAFARAGKKTFVDQTDPMYKTMNVSEKKGAKGNTIVLYALETLGELAAGKSSVALEAQALLKDEIFDGIDASKYSFAKKVDDFSSAFDAATRDSAAFSQARQEYLGASANAQAEAIKAMQSAGKQAIDSIRVALDWGAKAVRPDKKGKIKEEDRKKAQDEIDQLYLKYAVVAFALERYEDAFTVGDYLVGRNAEFENASQGAIVAMRALQAMSSRAREEGAEQDQLDALKAKLNAFSNRVAAIWSEDDASGVALEAAAIQLDAAVAAGDVETAKTLLAQIPENSTRRANAELRMGQALWNEWASRNAAFLTAKQEGEELDEATIAETKAKLDEILDAARQSLYDGLERMLNSSKGVTEKDYLAIYSTYLLAQVYEKLDQTAEVEKWLTHPVVGAQTMVERSLAAQPQDDEDIPDFINESFQLAVLALALSVAISDSEKYADAEKLMTTLEELAADSEDASGKLTGVYLRLGKRLEERMLELKDAVDGGEEDKQAELDAVVQGFESFLKRASDRDVGNSYASLRWIADSYLALGRGLTGVSGAPSKEALNYFSQAGKTYQTILKKIADDASFAPSAQTKVAIEIKTSECLRGAAQYKKAFEFLKNTIKENRDNIDVQKEAATIFQDWGRVEPKYYLTAIVGASPDAQGKNYVWGWNGIIRRAAPSIDKGERFKTLYYDAYLAKTRCRYLYLRKLKEKAEREKEARDAEADLERLYQTRPDLGGPATFNKFDSAYKNFQKARGENKPKSLREQAKAANAGSAKTSPANATKK